MISAIANANPHSVKSLGVSIEVIWLTEANVAGAGKFQGEIAKQLAERGFGALSVLSELEVTTITGGKCEASGAAISGEMSARMQIQHSGDNIVLDLEVQAEHSISDKRGSDITFSTTLTTPLDRWIVFGVAQRQSKASAEGARAKDHFLIRVKEQTPLRP